MAKIKEMASTAKKSAKIVMLAAATAMCENVGMELDKKAMEAAMRDMGIPVEDRAAVVVDMWDPFDGFCA